MTLTTRNIDEFFHRAPVRVNFAGLSGDTYKMRQRGWELNVHSHESYEYAAIKISFSGVHRGYGLKMFTSTLMLDHRMISSGPVGLIESIKHAEFEVLIETSARAFSISAPAPMSKITDNWSGLIEFNLGQKVSSFEEHFGFPEDGKVLIIPENKIWTVQEHLDAIRTVQQPHQDEILRGVMNDKKQVRDVIKLVAC